MKGANGAGRSRKDSKRKIQNALKRSRWSRAGLAGGPDGLRRVARSSRKRKGVERSLLSWSEADRFRLRLQTSGLLGGINAEIHLIRKFVDYSRAILATRLGQRSAAECE